MRGLVFEPAGVGLVAEHLERDLLGRGQFDAAVIDVGGELTDDDAAFAAPVGLAHAFGFAVREAVGEPVDDVVEQEAESLQARPVREDLGVSQRCGVDLVGDGGAQQHMLVPALHHDQALFDHAHERDRRFPVVAVAGEQKHRFHGGLAGPCAESEDGAAQVEFEFVRAVHAFLSAPVTGLAGLRFLAAVV